MATFIEEAQAILSPDEFAKLKSLAIKASNLETTTDEDDELAELKSKVQKAVFQREKLKSLQFLATGGFSVADVLTAMKADAKEVKKWLKGKTTEATETTSFVVGIFNGKDGKIEIRSNLKFAERSIATEIAKAGAKKFVESLNEAGKKWLAESHKATVGPYKGKVIHKNISKVATRFKFEKTALLKLVS